MTSVWLRACPAIILARISRIGAICPLSLLAHCAYSSFMSAASLSALDVFAKTSAVTAPQARGAVIAGWGATTPSTFLTNSDLAARLGMTEEWILERTGICERRIGGPTSKLATVAARQAMRSAGVEPADIDLLILATSTPDAVAPATSAFVHDSLGLECGAFDINSVCSGFIYALVAGFGFIGLGYDRILVIGADTLSSITDPYDPATAVLFGDGGGALVLEASADGGAVLSWDLGCDGSAKDILGAAHGGYIRMRGSEVFRRAVRAVVESCEKALQRCGVEADDIGLFVPHQANGRIIQAACDRLGIPLERTALTLARTGNTSSASIPFALAEALDAGRVSNGDLVLLTGFGAGMTWGSVVLRWFGGSTDSRSWSREDGEMDRA